MLASAVDARLGTHSLAICEAVREAILSHHSPSAARLLLCEDRTYQSALGLVHTNYRLSQTANPFLLREASASGAADRVSGTVTFHVVPFASWRMVNAWVSRRSPVCDSVSSWPLAYR